MTLLTRIARDLTPSVPRALWPAVARARLVAETLLVPLLALSTEPRLWRASARAAWRGARHSDPFGVMAPWSYAFDRSAAAWRLAWRALRFSPAWRCSPHVQYRATYTPGSGPVPESRCVCGRGWPCPMAAPLSGRPSARGIGR